MLPPQLGTRLLTGHGGLLVALRDKPFLVRFSMLPLNTSLGHLQFDEIFIEYDGPQLFSCFNEQQEYYLAVHAPATETDNWLFARISADRLYRVKQGKVSLHDAFKHTENLRLEIVAFSGIHPGTAQVTSVDALAVPADWLPDTGEFLRGATASEAYETYQGGLNLGGLGSLSLPTSNLPALATFSSPIAVAESLLAITPRDPMWEVTPEGLAYLKAIRTPVSVAANRTHRFTFDIILKVGDLRTDIPIKSLSKLLTSTQSVVDRFVYALGGATLGLQRQSRFHEQTRLNAVAAFPGSFGLRIETTEAFLIPNPALRQALVKLVNLLSSKSEDEKTASRLVGLDNKSITHFRNFVKILEGSESGFSLDLGIPGEDAPLNVDLTQAQVIRLARSLDAEAKLTEERIIFSGRLIGFSLKTKYFMLENEDTVISGRIAEGCLSTVVGKTIGALYKTTILILTEINEATAEETEKHILESISDI